MTLELGDGQVRKYFLTGENLMKCFFYVDQKQTGWCLWCRDEGGTWRTTITSKGNGMAVARPHFGDILDDVYSHLLLEWELS